VWWDGASVTCELYLDREGCSWTDEQAELCASPALSSQLVSAEWWKETLSRLPRSRMLLRGLRPTVKVWLSGFWARPFVLELPSGLKSSEWSIVAAARAAAEVGFDVNCSVKVQSPQGVGAGSGSRGLAVAVPLGLLTALMEGAKSAGVRLKSIRPWWAGALDEVLQDGKPLELFSAADTDSVVLLVGSSDSWMLATTSSPRPFDQDLERWYRRQSLSLDSAALQPTVARHVEVCFGDPAPKRGLWPRPGSRNPLGQS